MFRSAPLPWILDQARRHLAIWYVWLCGFALAVPAMIHFSDLGDDMKIVLSIMCPLFFFFGVGGLCVLRFHVWPCFAEVMHVIIAMLVIAIGWVGILFTPSFARRQRSMAAWMVLWSAFPSLIGVRFLPTMIVIVWSTACNMCVSVGAERVYGDVFEIRTFAVMICYAFLFIFITQLQQTRMLRWHEALQEVLAEKLASEALLSMLCDGAFWLAGDGDTIKQSDGRLEDGLGAKSSMEGEQLSQCILDSTEERERLSHALKRAQHSPVMLPTTFVHNSASRCVAVELMIVKRSTDDTVIEDRDGIKKGQALFLVGFRLGAGERGVGHACPLPAVKDQDVNLRERHDCELLAGVRTDDAHSVTETTATAVFFEAPAACLKVGDMEGMRLALREITQLGSREHWLLPHSDVNIKPEHILGSGGFGVVVGAMHCGSPVAVKVSRSQTGCLRQLPSLVNELRVLRFVRHPNIVVFFGACLDPTSAEIALVFEWVEGRSLDDFAQPPPAPPDSLDRFRIILDVACALRYLHALRPCVVHSDVKSGNVLVELLGTRPRAKLVDFGLSRLMSPNARVLGGSLQWMAPEVIRNGLVSKPASSSDVFSFGRLVFCIVAGKKNPIDYVTRETVVDMAHLGISPPLRWPVPAVPLAAECLALCDACISWNPAERPTMASVQDELLGWQLPGPETLHDVSGVGGPEPWLCPWGGGGGNGGGGVLCWAEALEAVRKTACATESAAATAADKATAAATVTAAEGGVVGGEVQVHNAAAAATKHCRRAAGRGGQKILTSIAL
eukprot:TRINITY_DN5739_c0_g1_i3.p1 TRINITY_DN5739_c0_g1~~TRINITY_DN5739_c0_g1_i3.p1  ORF type:complete len:787 (-),score=125.20 TRINITY_DN5739_c0_g1_i3:142-2502(-)